MTIDTLTALRQQIRTTVLGDEAAIIQQLLDNIQTGGSQREAIVEQASDWVKAIRADNDPGLMESFLAEYGLSTQEGVALMCLAEAYLRVPDDETLDELINDKITPQDFARHLGHSGSLMVNASTWGLMLTGNILSESDKGGLLPVLQGLVRRAGEPLIRAAVRQMMKLMGGQFVLGQDIEAAVENGKSWQARGYRYSFDMLGEAALTQEDANRYHLAYADAITELARQCQGRDVRFNPGISVKLSALYPRYETLQKAEVMDNLLPAIRSLCVLAKKAGMGLNIDAEEAERLDLSLDIIEALLADSSLKNWNGLGVVVQAYGYRAPLVLDWLYAAAQKYQTRLMVRLVKGAYWDREIKRSQELGLRGYPVYTRKNNTDVSYWYCAQKLLGQRDHIFPQFATHNAHTMAAVLAMTAGEDYSTHSFEFQRLHGMGESLHECVREQAGIPTRIYAPVGVHQDLLAYLVRRLLENGANASFVNQLLDQAIPPREVVADPLAVARAWLVQPVVGVAPPEALFLPERMNSHGFDWQDAADVLTLEALRNPYRETSWAAVPLLAPEAATAEAGAVLEVRNPATLEPVGQVTEASLMQLELAVQAAVQAQPDWQGMGSHARAACLNRAAALYEAHAGEIFALLMREAGKTMADAIAELREAVDFLRYYAARSERIAEDRPALGVVACISPWNFPLAIFTGQLSAALAVGNTVLVKPAEATPLIAHLAVRLLHEAGVPLPVLQFLPGSGAVIGAALSGHPALRGLVFTGSTATAKRIETAMAQSGSPEAVLIAETGGLNAMIVDSSALPEQAVNDILTSAFRSAGQRCSALRLLLVQEDVAERMLEMLKGGMALLQAGDPWHFNTDLGPVIDARAQSSISAYIEAHRADVLAQLDVPGAGHFIPPTLIRVRGMADLTHEVFGPVLHVATFKAGALAQVVADINAAGYGLTFGLHTRIDARVQAMVDALRVGNIYVNRNQIGAIVGSQPFGGEGLSGTGPKAGGPYYLERLVQAAPVAGTGDTAAAVVEAVDAPTPAAADVASALARITGEPESPFGRLPPLGGALLARYSSVINACRQQLPETVSLPGPTGEDNLLSLHARGLTVVASPDPDTAFRQVLQALYCGNPVLVFNAAFDAQQRAWLQGCPRLALLVTAAPAMALFSGLPGLACVAFTPDSDDPAAALRSLRQALAARSGPIVRHVSERLAPALYMHERHLCVNTTAAGGNVSLIAGAG